MSVYEKYKPQNPPYKSGEQCENWLWTTLYIIKA